jgi:hypothetical protein
MKLQQRKTAHGSTNDKKRKNSEKVQQEIRSERTT